MGGNAKNLFMVLGFLVALVLLVFGLNELRGILVGAENKISPSQVNVSGITGNSAIINFSTEKPTFSRVIYGSDPQKLSLFSVETHQTDTHTVTLSFLSPNTTYYFKIRISDKEFDDNGAPYSFTTRPAESGASGVTENRFDNLDQDVFKQKFGTSDPEYDVNQDGVVNTTDYLLYLQKTQ